MNISTSQKNKTKTEIYKVLQLLFTMFHILKSLHNIFIINPTSYNSFNVQNQTIIHPPFDWFISNLLRYLNELLLLFFLFFFLSLRLTNFYFCCWALFFPLILNQIGLLLGGFFLSVQKRQYIVQRIVVGWAASCGTIIVLGWAASCGTRPKCSE